MSKVKICVIGGGNITNTRHIPALRKLKNVEIIGVIGSNEKKVEETCKNNNIINYLIVNDPKNDKGKVEKCEWFKDVDAVVIGTPPQQHYPLIKLALELKKDVLCEKPMTLNVKEADELIKLAEKNNLIFNVVHNFNFTSGMNKLNEIIKNKKYGDIKSIAEVQFTNRRRRLPNWYQTLPLGLFFDEAAHFIYLIQNHCGEIENIRSMAIYHDEDGNTPSTLSVSASAGNVPIHMYLDFNSPVCEWYYVVNFENKIALYDLFKDILIIENTDNEHYASDILKNDLSRSSKYWLGFIKNGFKMVGKNLLYGHETVLDRFISNVESRKVDEYLDCKKGRETVKTMEEICDNAEVIKC